MAARLWDGGQLLFATQMNQDVSGNQDDLAGRNGVIELEDGLVIPGEDGYIRLPRRAGVMGLDQSAGGVIYDTDTDRLMVSDGTQYETVRIQELTAGQISGLLGTTATTIAEGNHSHG